MKRIILQVAMCLSPLFATAQSNGTGANLSVGIEKKLDSRWSIGASAEFRSRNTFKTADRWLADLSADYKICTWLKANATYAFIYDHRRDNTSYNVDNSPNNYRPSYWTPKHRFNLALTASKSFGRFKLSLRERWMYTYRPAKETKRYDYDNGYWEMKEVKSKSENVLRSRLQGEYNIPKSKITPYASVEAFTAKKLLEETRFTAGAELKIKKKHVFSAFYRYCLVNKSADPDGFDKQLVGLEYKFKF